MILRKLEDFVRFIISGHNLINRRYAADTMLMADSAGKLKELLNEIVKEIEKKKLSSVRKQDTWSSTK